VQVTWRTIYVVKNTVAIYCDLITLLARKIKRSKKKLAISCQSSAVSFHFATG